MRTVQLIGKAPADGLVRAEPGVERWYCNDYNFVHDWDWDVDPWDRWFDRHTRGHILKHRPGSWWWYASRDTHRPIYLLDRHEEIKASVRYPIEDVQAAFAWGGHAEEYFTSSLDYMIALALLEGVPRIELVGMDLWDAAHERGVQRNGAHYWIGMARGRGVDVVIPDASSLCKIERMYGSFALTSPRNFASVSLDRWLEQLRAAEAMDAPGFVPAGVDGG